MMDDLVLYYTLHIANDIRCAKDKRTDSLTARYTSQRRQYLPQILARLHKSEPFRQICQTPISRTSKSLAINSILATFSKAATSVLWGLGSGGCWAVENWCTCDSTSAWTFPRPLKIPQVLNIHKIRQHQVTVLTFLTRYRTCLKKLPSPESKWLGYEDESQQLESAFREWL